jgi:hypothetical protein
MALLLVFYLKFMCQQQVPGKLVTYLGSLGVVMKIANYVMLPKESRQVELMDVSCFHY